ncbi:MAG: TonB-dependent receptor [Alphaproteobacteria bacterium]|nr:MAG: TonB-dependent receptor [Alphaproteobacteria bacterium]
MSNMSKLLCGVSLVILVPATSSYAEDAENSDADLLLMDEIVVTGTAGGTTKLHSSVSVSSIGTERISDFAPRSTAEIFRNIPGIRSESSGGEGNANIAVRGLPVASGGAKFLQLHEDGLPVMEFGDIAFGNADIFLRADYSIDRIEAIRGGSASTFASNSPGGVINFISKTGEESGGSIGATIGLDFNSTRVDFEYGTPINDTLRFHVAGFYRDGEGPRRAGFNGNSGGQIKANITKEFENGYVRLYFKHLNDHAIGILPMAVSVTGTDSDPNVGSVVGFDAGSDTPHSVFFQKVLGLDGDNNRRTTDISDGMRPVSTSVGAEFSFDLDEGLNITNKFRVTSNSGRFVSPFPAEIADAQTIADSIGGAGSTLSYANGPDGGSVIRNPAGLNGNGLLMRTHLFNVEINDFGIFTNDLRLKKSFDMDGDTTVNLVAGYYKSRQTIDMDWVWDTFLLEVKGDNAALIDVTDASGNLVTDNGLVAFGVPFWGNCCTRSYDTTYDIDAPYASVSIETDKLNIDASIRYDTGDAFGTFAGSVQSLNFDVNQDGVISVPEQSVSVLDNANPSVVDYDWSYWSYSLGANYAFSDDLAAFARYSRGGRANADRLLFGRVNADGSVSEEDAVDFVEQIEVGVKYRTDNLGVFATFFYAKTEEQNFEATSQKFFDKVFKSKGVELELVYQIEGFDFRGSVTYTDAEIDKDVLNAAVEGNTPRRQADLIYSFTPSYTYDRFTVGANVIGTTSSFAQDSNQLVMPGYTQVNAFAYVEVVEGLRLSVNANNLFDVIGLTESEEGSIPANGVIRARSIAGRSITASLKYSF